MFKAIKKEIKDEILGKIKEGQKAPSLAEQYGISSKTIYTWLSNLVKPEVSLIEYNKLRRENDELKRIIGIMALDLELSKKKRNTSNFLQTKN